MIAATVLAVVAATGAGVPGGEPSETSAMQLGTVRWTAEPAPFRLSFTDAGRPLLAQVEGQLAGPGGRMAYALADGSTHRPTDLLRTEPGRDATTYVVATDEPARTARVTVARTARGLRVEWRLLPADGVAQVYEALTGTDGEHFLGGGANFIYTDLRHRVLLCLGGPTSATGKVKEVVKYNTNQTDVIEYTTAATARVGGFNVVTLTGGVTNGPHKGKTAVKTVQLTPIPEPTACAGDQGCFKIVRAFGDAGVTDDAPVTDWRSLKTIDNDVNYP